jgi:murein DD-endopeptidase MepM/ murein hydrolase activator NlpD
MSVSLLFLSTLFSILGVVSAFPDIVIAQTPSGNCPTPALARFQRHKAARGETVESIAASYNLTPETIIDMNPGIRKGTVAVGSEILIPPYNGIVIEVSGKQSWRQIAEKYKVRADALFELNGCQPPSKLAFIPVSDSSTRAAALASPTNTDNKLIQISGYPLKEVAKVALPYGWQINRTTGEVFFHSGVDLLAAVGTGVIAIAPGTVAFAGEQGSYGKLVVINHGGGLQSRYAQLEDIKVSVGQQIQQGDQLGGVGTTGQPTSSQPHLHFEIRASSSLGWVAKDPKVYLNQ